MRLQNETRKLPTKLTPEELAEESKRLAEAVEAVEKQEGEIAKQVEAWKERKKGLDGYLAHLRTGMNDLAVIVNTETMDRDVECSWLYALRQGYAFLVRDDTGDLVHHRKLGEQERQTEILEVIREPTEEQLTAWTESLGLVVDPQGDLPLAAADGPVYYYRDFTLTMEHGDERITGRFTEADHRPASLDGVHVIETPSSISTIPEIVNKGALVYIDGPEHVRPYRQALEDLLAAKTADAVAKNRAGGDPTVAERMGVVPGGTTIGRGKRERA